MSPSSAEAWLDRIDPGMHRRIKGLRLVTAFGIASMLGTMGDITHGLPGGASLNVLAGSFGLWAGVPKAERRVPVQAATTSRAAPTPSR